MYAGILHEEKRMYFVQYICHHLVWIAPKVQGYASESKVFCKFNQIFGRLYVPFEILHSILMFDLSGTKALYIHDNCYLYKFLKVFF